MEYALRMQFLSRKWIGAGRPTSETSPEEYAAATDVTANEATVLDESNRRFVPKLLLFLINTSVTECWHKP
jgi:hypothetical protein